MSARDHRRAYADYLRLMGIGITMFVIILLCTWLGWWLDGLLGWKVPVLTIFFALLGIAGAMMHLFKETRPRH